jgi:5-methylthioadenosine/S-adenosylhomocysteine deaminase
VRAGALRIRGESIAELGDLAPLPGEPRVRGHGRHALPGFVQGHVHGCQTLFRGLGDDLELLPWLRTRIWPLEHALDADAARASAELTFCELLRGGTTTVQTMESVRHAEQTFAAALDFGLCAVVGNCLMDVADDGTPAGMTLDAAASLRACEALWREFHGRAGRLFYALAPRFLLSCSEALARDAAAFARQCGLRVHTHAAEHPGELRAVRERFGRDYVAVLADQGLLGGRTSLAHCVHTNDAERELLRATDTAVLHCPSANLRLGSGIAPVAAYRALGLRVALGADGAPCNNRLSALTEMRLCARLQALAAGPGRFPAAAALWTATRGGARALRLDDQVGSLRPGLRADVCLFDLDDSALRPGGDVASRIVHGADERHLTDVLLGGRFVLRDGRLRAHDAAAIAAAAEVARDRVLARAGLAR